MTEETKTQETPVLTGDDFAAILSITLAMAAEVGLAAKLDAAAGELSGGQRRKVGGAPPSCARQLLLRCCLPPSAVGAVLCPPPQQQLSLDP